MEPRTYIGREKKARDLWAKGNKYNQRTRRFLFFIFCLILVFGYNVDGIMNFRELELWQMLISPILFPFITLLVGFLTWLYLRMLLLLYVRPYVFILHGDLSELKNPPYGSIEHYENYKEKCIPKVDENYIALFTIFILATVNVFVYFSHGKSILDMVFNV